MKKILIILCLLLITGCNKNEYYSKNLFYMDTVINIKLYNVNENKANDAFKNIENLYLKYEKIVNFYDENSELYKINNSNEEVIISDELKELINIGIDWYYKSNGLLNINIGPITKIWHDFRNELISFPTEQQFGNLDININNIMLNDNTIKGNFKIDLGSFAKGFVTEKAGKYLEEVGIDYYIINAGGNVKVGKSNKGYYNIGIKSPVASETFEIIKGENISVVTSGGYERFFEYEGIKYHHIIDPNTKYPANYIKSVTIIGTDSTLCDILSTTLFLMSIEDGKEFIKDYEVDVIWFTNDNQIIKSEGFNYE